VDERDAVVIQELLPVWRERARDTGLTINVILLADSPSLQAGIAFALDIAQVDAHHEVLKRLRVAPMEKLPLGALGELALQATEITKKIRMGLNYAKCNGKIRYNKCRKNKGNPSVIS